MTGSFLRLALSALIGSTVAFGLYYLGHSYVIGHWLDFMHATNSDRGFILYAGVFFVIVGGILGAVASEIEGLSK